MQNKNKTEHFFSEQEFLKELCSIAGGKVPAVLRDGHIAVTRIVQTKQKGNGAGEDSAQPVIVPGEERTASDSRMRTCRFYL